MQGRGVKNVVAAPLITYIFIELKALLDFLLRTLLFSC